LLLIREFDGVTAAIGVGTILAGLLPMRLHRHRRDRLKSRQ